MGIPLSSISCWCFLLFLFIGIPLIPALVYEDDPKELLDWCIDARHHKSRPGPTDGLHKQVRNILARLAITFSYDSSESNISVLWIYLEFHSAKVGNGAHAAQRKLRLRPTVRTCIPSTGITAITSSPYLPPADVTLSRTFVSTSALQIPDHGL